MVAKKPLLSGIMASWLQSAIKSCRLGFLSFFKVESVDVEAVESSRNDPLPSSLPTISTTSSQTQIRTYLPNSMAQAFRDLEIGKSFLTFIWPMASILLAVNGKHVSPPVLVLILCLLSAAFVALLFGISLRVEYPWKANVLEQVGIAFIYMSFFILVASNLPSSAVWFPLICCVLCVGLSIRCCLPVTKP
ncbi:hypothetical protein TEA_025197 [Camellia sinensis var. sinensis]|uniref:Uncharacterized protein n=1 Tax=Camellia sinensis var. sinensis TaxID=542762 RepID=A0A4S4E548_CAMSN|nr:hypothetical protein TEA_025197 [Camellia sinensis var. sinensis]